MITPSQVNTNVLRSSSKNVSMSSEIACILPLTVVPVTESILIVIS